MNRMTPFRFSLLSFAAVTMTASMAQADECVSDADCPAGFACEETSWAACPTMPPCEEGAECPEPPECEDGSEFVCVVSPQECDTDADCDGGLTCVTFTSETCTGEDTPPPVPGGDDAPDSDAPEPDAPCDTPDDPGPDCEETEFSCSTTTESYCAPAYVGSCAADADCGEGFTCAEIEQCSCSSGGGTGSTPTPTPDPDGEDSGGSDSGSDSDDDSGSDSDDDHSCECEGAGEFYCQPNEVTCDADADCPTDWTCEDMGGPDVVCVGAPGEEDNCGDTPVAPELRCLPPGWEAWSGAGGGRDYDEVGTDSPTTGGEESQDDGTPTPSAPNANGVTQDEDQGCSATGGNTAGGMFGLMLAGLALMRRRR